MGKNLGGTGDDSARSVQQTSDGGFVIVGFSSSNDGDIGSSYGSYDTWITKLDSSGNLTWEKNLGGSSVDQAFSIQQSNDGGFIIAGTSASNDGDVSGNNGNRDYWVVKLSSDGSSPGPPNTVVNINSIDAGDMKLTFDPATVKFEDNTLSKVTEISFNVTIEKEIHESTQTNNGLWIQMGPNGGQGIKVDINDLHPEALDYKNGLPRVIPKSDAQKSIGIIDKAIKLVTSEMSKMGAIQNRFEHALNNSSNYESNLTAAESRIADADMAKQVMEMTKNQMLSQASQAMLSQANQMPQQVLQLLSS